MKTKILSILGVFTVLAMMLATLGAAPVSAATCDWSDISGPETMPNVIFVGPIAQAADGTLYVSVGMTDNDDDADDGVFIYKSTDGGRTWAKTKAQPGQTGEGLDSNIVGPGNTDVYTDIQCPGTDGSLVYVTDGFDIFKTTDGGVTWIPLTNLFEKLDDAEEPPEGTIVSLSTGYVGGSAYTFAATSTFGSGEGGVYVLQESVFLNPWADLEVGEDRPNNTFSYENTDALKVQVFPDFSTTQGVMAVVSNYEFDQTPLDEEDDAFGQTLVTTKYGAAQWDATANDVVLMFNQGGVTLPDYVDAALLGASIYIPTDFSSNPTGNMVAFVGINPIPDPTQSAVNGLGTYQGDVFLCTFGPANPVNSTPYDLNIDGADGVAVSGMSGVGASNTAAILVSGYDTDDTGIPNTWTTQDGGITWMTTDDNPAGKRPTGGPSPLFPVALSSCVVMDDFATSGTALVGTHGVDCGLSLTQDFGKTWNTIAFIASPAVGAAALEIGDLSFAADGSIYLTTVSGGEAGDVYYGIWRYAGGYWERVNSWSLYDVPPFTTTDAVDWDFIRTTPDQSAVFVTNEVGGQSQLYRSVNKGQTWTQWGMPLLAEIHSFLVVSPTTVAIGSADGMVYTTTNGSLWYARNTGMGSGYDVTDLRLASNGDYLAAGANGTNVIVAKSSNAGVSWSKKTAASATSSDLAFVSPAADYATSGVVYATGDDEAQIYWGVITGTSTFKTADSDPDDWYMGDGATGLVTAAGGPGFSAEGTGMAYATAEDESGVERIRGRVASGDTAAGEFIPGPGADITRLWIGANAVGGATLYALEPESTTIWTYTDAMNVPTSGVKATAVTANECGVTCPTGTASGVISWNAVGCADAYFVIVAPVQMTNLYDAIDMAELYPGMASITSALSITWTGAPNTTYYVSVWGMQLTSDYPSIDIDPEVAADRFEALEGAVVSTFGSGASFTTPLAAPANLAPSSTTTNVPVMPTFSWSPISGATGYQLQISTSADFSSTVFDSGTTNPITATTYVYTGSALTNDTGYYWRVRALGAVNSAWTSSVFTTIQEATPPVVVTQNPQPTIVITQQAPITITVPAPPPAQTFTVTEATYTLTTPTAETPAYIWIIVAVGAVLTLAVIILIIRTRRVV